MSNNINIRRQLLNALKRGTGEAYLIVKNNPNIDFSTQIIKGALNIFAYDGQCEGNRAQYIFDIISISKQKTKIKKAVLRGLAREQDETWNLTHLFALAKLFATQGDGAAKKTMYDRFLNPPIEYSDWVGASEILALDGLEGLFYVAEKFGQYIEKNPDDCQDDSIIEAFQAKNEQIKVYTALKKQAKTNKYIAIYLKNIKRTQKNEEKYQEKNKTIPRKYEDIIDEVLNSKPFFGFRRQFNMTDEGVNQIAKRLMVETNTSNIEKLLYIFDCYKFPYDSQIILDFAKQKPTRKNRIVEFAICALKHLKSQDIRNFFIEKIENAKNPIDYLEILMANYESGDHKILNAIAHKTNNEHKIEQLAIIYTDIYSENSTKECQEPLEILYYKMNCAIHRNSIVKILIENEVLSAKIKSEIEFDCDLDTRELA